jgi:hypothetical protein
MLALSVLILVTQEADAAAVNKKFSFKQAQVNKCSDSAKCSHTATITIRLPGGDGDDPDH